MVATLSMSHTITVTVAMMNLLGHSTFDMTLQVYAHPIIGGNRRHSVMDRMAENLLTGNEITIDAAAIPTPLAQELRITS